MARWAPEPALWLAGLLLAAWGREVREQGEILILLAGVLLFCVGAARALNLSGMIVSLSLGGRRWRK